MTATLHKGDGEMDAKRPEAGRIPLSQMKQALLAQRLRGRSANALRVGRIPRLGFQSSYPVSFQQERMWFLDRLEPGSFAYTLPQAFRLRGPVESHALELGLKEVVNRHAALRSALKVSDGQLLQHLTEPGDGFFERLDFSAFSPCDQEAEIRREIDREMRKPFDLTTGSLLRARLFFLKEGDHLLFLNFHHVACDGWSFGILYRELSHCYESIRAGRNPNLSEVTLQYHDFAAWQREFLQGEHLEGQLNYWRRALSESAALQLPTDRPRKSRSSHRGDRIELKLGSELSRSIVSFNRGHNSTPFMTFLAAFQVLLSRYSGQDDILVGTPVASRTRTELEEVVGFVANTLVIRGLPAGDLTFKDFVEQIKRTTLEAFQHQDLPFEKVVEAVKPDRRSGMHPIFQVLFALQNAEEESLHLPGIEVFRQALPVIVTRFDLELHVWPAGEGWAAWFYYDTDLFDRGTIERMVSHFRTLLEWLIEHPNVRLSSARILPVPERDLLLTKWNETTLEYPKDRTIPELFEEQVQSSPDSIALEFGKYRVTYSDLSLRSDRLADALRHRGVGPDVLVGVCVERSIEMVVALLGILKAGAAYLPIDASWPEERVDQVFSQAAPAVILQNRGWNLPIPLQFRERVFEMPDGSTREEKTPRPPVAVGPESLAYVMFTSGSTGTPKGVEIVHRGVVRLVKGGGYADFGSDQVFLQLAPLAFDASTFEIWGPLLNGGRLVIMPPHQPTLEEIGESIKTHGISTLWLTSGLFQLMVERRVKDLKPLRQLLAGGDVLPSATVEAARKNLPECRIINGYGPTEGTTFSCCYEVEKSTRWDRTIPIGRPIGNTTVYILDAELRPVPIGVPGEIHIGGDGLARGYLGAPEATSERFIEHPFGRQTGAKLYKTGDLGRYLPDGNIEFLGRNDNQVKIRGFRIELGEIESILRQHRDVEDCAVVIRERPSGDKRLVAYVTCREPNVFPAVDLDRLLKRKLPAYARPDSLISLPALPLTPNGKVDRRALPPPVEIPEATRPSIPRTQVETTVASIWGEVLGRAEVGVDDNFFELGGHSLSAVHLLDRIERAFDKSLSVATVFESPTLREFVERLDEGAESAPVSFTSTPGGETPGSNVFCLHFLSAAQRLSTYLAPDWRVVGIESPIREELIAWHTRGELNLTIEELARRFLPQIQGIQPKGPYFLVGFCFAGILAFEVARQLAARGERVALLGLLDAVYPQGCKRRWFPALRRMAFHASRTLQLGPRYLATKVNRRIGVLRRRRVQLRALAEKPPGWINRETQVQPDLPHARFLSQLLAGYGADPYANDAVLIRSVRDPLSFGLDLGITSGWGRVICGDLKVLDIHCTHHDMFEVPHLSEIGLSLKAELTAAREREERDRVPFKA